MEDEKTLLENLLNASREAGLEAARFTLAVDTVQIYTLKDGSGNETLDTKYVLDAAGLKNGKLAEIHLEDVDDDLDPTALAKKLSRACAKGRPYSASWFLKPGVRLGKSDAYSSKFDKLPPNLMPAVAEKTAKRIQETSSEISSQSVYLIHFVGHTTMYSYDPSLEPGVIAAVSFRRDGLKLAAEVELTHGKEKVKASASLPVRKSLENIDEGLLARTVVRLATNKLGLTPLAEPFEGSVLVCPQAAAIILSAACSHLDGKRIAEGKSVYQGKLGTDVFSETLIVLNDPFTASDFARPFDMEGTPTEKFMAIDRGRLRCLFLNCEYAEKNGGKTNGCAGLGDACRCQYLVVTPSATGVAEMVSSMGEGLILEEIDNTRELRVDPETLDYRIPFTGWIVHEGQRQTPVSGTLLGNAAEACQKIDEISRERGDFYGCLTPWFRIPDQRAE